MYHCLGNQGSVGTTPGPLLERLFTVCCSNHSTWAAGAALWVPGSACPQPCPGSLRPPPYLGVPGEAHVPPPVPAQGSLPGAAVAEVVEGLSLHHLRAQRAAVTFSRGHRRQFHLG